MTRLSQKQYESRVVLAMIIYAGLLLFVWPLLRTMTSVPLKWLLALAPVVPVVYVIGLLARRIESCDELEQRTHLVALAAATAVTSALSLAGGFLCIAGVVSLDGSILIWVFPVMMGSYAVARWRVLRGYGASMASCDDQKSVWFYVRFALLGLALLAVAVLGRHHLADYSLGFIYGTGFAFAGSGLVLALLRAYRKRSPDE
ncbi:hypothetical protein [Dyella mobilis]|uniref:Uncharacterized protein n=1 Tax=Dyella mobilis TaxID=1849582 RepID=A0ABS2KBN8_9GAMM|nr:hypothetical protein [Dyella mobilis]MBM7128598.1 hypothetical protein [Dyella mobilis]GLQ99498.1 hypothetical protein GCM10007863_39180 [Dyella mobilis]